MNINQQVQQERVKALYQQSISTMIGLVLTSFATAFFFWGVAESALVIGWLIGMLVMVTGRALLIWRFRTIASTDFNTSTWSWYFTIGVIFSGALFGASAILFVDFASPNTIIFETLILFGSVAGGLAVLSLFLPAYYLFSALALGPLIFLFYQHDGELYVFSALIVVFVSLYFAYAKNMQNTLITSIEQRFENQQLVKDLTLQTQIAEQANRDKSRFLAATSHDLRQPLHSLGLFLHVLKEKQSTEEQKELMQHMEKSQQALSDQLNAIIDITRMDAGELELNKQSFQLKEFIEGIVSEFSLIAEQTNSQIRTHLSDDWIHTDKLLFARIVRNFISNVIQHSPGSTLLIASRHRGSHFELRFIDNGLGIAETNQDVVFSEFYQLNNPERDRNKGLGLGLSIVKRLSALLGMNVKLTSRLNHGSNFTLSWNYDAPDISAEHRVLHLNRDRDIDLSGLFIVIVDDDDENLSAMKAILQLWGCEILIANREEDLMNELQSIEYPTPDMLLIDFRLRDGMNGINTIRAIRKHFAQSVPATIITGDTTMDIESQMIGKYCYLLYKPLSTETLRTHLYENAVKHRQNK